MIKNKETFYNKQPMIDYGMVTTILINETPVIIEYDDVADDGSPVKVKRQMYRYDSYRLPSAYDWKWRKQTAGSFRNIKKHQGTC